MMVNAPVLWGAVLALGFPLLTLLLGEVIDRLERRHHPLVKSLRQVRRYLLPCLGVVLVMRIFFGFTDASFTLRGAETLVWLAVLLAGLSLINVVLTSKNDPKPWQVTVPNLLFQFIRTAVLAAVIGYVFAGIWKVDLTKTAEALGVGSVVIALALQDTLSNLVSGFLLIFEQPFKVGQWIKVGDCEGEVIDLNWRATRIMNIEGDVYVIPNGALGGETILNLTHDDDRSRWEWTQLKFSYDDTPHQIQAILARVILETPGIVPEVETPAGMIPGVMIIPNEFEGSGISYRIAYCVAEHWEKYAVQTELMGRIYYAIKRNRLTVPFNVGVELDEVPDKEVYDPQEIRDFLRSQIYLNVLDDSAIKTLSERVSVEYYGAGEEIIHIGELDRGFYIIVEGSVQLFAEDADLKEHRVDTISSGEIFGEMVLLRGSPSLVSVRVLEDVKVIVADRLLMTHLAENNNRFALEINRFIEARRRMIHAISGVDEASVEATTMSRNGHGLPWARSGSRS